MRPSPTYKLEYEAQGEPRAHLANSATILADKLIRYRLKVFARQTGTEKKGELAPTSEGCVLEAQAAEGWPIRGRRDGNEWDMQETDKRCIA